MNKIRKIELRNGRMIDYLAYHDLYIDGVLILEKELYTTCYNYVLRHGNDNDWYTEPDSNPNYQGETVKELKIKEEKYKEFDKR